MSITDSAYLPCGASGCAVVPVVVAVFEVGFILLGIRGAVHAQQIDLPAFEPDTQHAVIVDMSRQAVCAL